MQPHFKFSDENTMRYNIKPVSSSHYAVATMIIMAGIPGSGKTTLAKTQYPGFERVSLDDIRLMPAGERRRLLEASRSHADIAPYTSRERRMEHVLIERALEKGRDIVVDDTNTTAEIRSVHIAHASKYGYDIHAVSFYNFDAAADRNRQRSGGERIPDAAVAAKRSEFEPPKIEEGFESVRAIF